MINQEIGILIEKIARNLQSAIWMLQNTIDDLQRLGIAIAEVNKEEKKSSNVKKRKGE